MTNDTSSQLSAMVEVAEAQVEGLQSRLAEISAAARLLQAKLRHLHEQLESSAQQRHRERDALETTNGPVKAGMGVLLEQKQRDALAQEAENRERSVAITEELTSTEKMADEIRVLLNEAIAKEQALRKQQLAAHREKQRSREEEELEELDQNARARALQKKSE